jgi:hypothetical protein
MSKITIDDKEYELETLSDDAKAQLDMLISTDKRIVELQRELAIFQTARIAYSRALGDALPN